ncbi:hypothetical protein MNB_SV-14-178 [hydrothermal vent metagenome]|uniref:Uncharacterized protein n=1 Tax=hydrothermal vent metagenome TaxID=652676 RepID=A0A1W1CSH4_9ZZZZ
MEELNQNLFLKINLLTLVFFVLLLSGCSSIAVHNPMVTNNKKMIELSYCVSSSSEMTKIKDVLTSEENKKVFNKNINDALKDISLKIESGIEHTEKLHIVILDKCIDNSVALKQKTDLYLTIELSGYGSVKEEWKNMLIGAGIAEGVIQGIVVGVATSNPWLGVAVGAEEMTSEYLTWNGVDWIFGEAYAPVTLEGTLIDVKNNKIIWKDSSFITDNEEILSDEEKKDKSLQLKASLYKAEEELFSSLNEYLKNEIIQNMKKD